MSQKFTHFLIFCLGILFLIQCERPGSPDFKLSRNLEFPVYNERSIYLLGGRGALIDTTAENFRDLFVVDEESFITLSKEESFEFGNLHSAIPDISILPKEFQARVGPILISDFSSGDNLGSADFLSLTGLNPGLVNEGDMITGGTTPSPVNIPLATDYFVSATITDGGLNIVLENDLGFDIAHLELDLYSGTVFVQSATFADLQHGDNRGEYMDVTPGTVLENLNIDVSITWDDQLMLDNPGELIVRDLTGENLEASEVVAVTGQQNFNFKSQINIATNEFRFTTFEHFIEIDSGSLIVSEIENGLDVDLEWFEITFSDIRHPPYQAADSLIIRVEGSDKIVRKSSGHSDLTADLSGMRIYGEGNQVEYNVRVRTEDTRSGPGSELRTINENDEVSAVVEITDFDLDGVFGVVANRGFFLSEDSPITGTGQIDLFNSNEAHRIDLKGLKDFSGKLDGLEFTDASFSVNYQTNIGFPITIIGAFLGITKDGKMIYLSGVEGQPTFVNNPAKAQGLFTNGTQLNTDQLIRFTVDTNQEGVQNGSITFNRENSNIVEFLNNIPSEIRFIGKADLNPDEVEGTLQIPVEFDPAIAIDMPLSIRTVEQASYTETLDVNLSDLPDESDDLIIEEGTIKIQYRNNFPLQVSVAMDFLDAGGNLITSVPGEGQQEVAIQAAEAGASGFSVPGGQAGNMVVSLNNEQLRNLNLTDTMNLSLGLRTFDRKEVKLRATDQVTVSISAKFILESAVN